MKTRLLSRKDIESFFTMTMCMEAVEKAFADLATGNAMLPQRTPITVPDQHGLALFMPAHIKSLKALGAKVVTVYKDNVPTHGLPTVLGTIILLDEATGVPVALLDGGYLTAMRTGAVSGVATKYMANPEAKVAVVFGTGAQAFTQVLGVHEARPLAKLLAYSLDAPEARRKFATRVTEATGVPVVLADDPKSAVAQADIVILATTAATPVLDGRWLKPGSFWPFRGDYWVIELGEDYEYAVVSAPSMKYLWILSRTPRMDEHRYQAIVSRLKDRGFEIAKLNRTPQGNRKD